MARRRGSSAVILVVGLVLVCGFVAMGLAWTALAPTHAELQAVADSAAVAGATALPDAAMARKRAKAYAAQSTVRGRPVTLTDVEITVGSWDRLSKTCTPGDTPDNDAIRIALHTELRMPFTGLFGVGRLQVGAVAGGGASTGRSAPDLVIVQDVTASFSEEIGFAREAVLALADCVHRRSGPQTTVGITVFTGQETNLLAPDELVTYGTAYPQITSALSSLNSCGVGGMPPCSGTNIAAGLWQARRALARSTSDPEIGRAAVLVSDGIPNANSVICSRTEDPDTGATVYRSDALVALCPGWGNLPTDAKLAQSALDLRDAFAASGYDLYTVFYNETSDAVASAFMEELVTGKGSTWRAPRPRISWT